MKIIPGVTILDRVKNHCQAHWFHQHAECRNEDWTVFNACMMASFSDKNGKYTHIIQKYDILFPEGFDPGNIKEYV